MAISVTRPGNRRIKFLFVWLLIIGAGLSMTASDAGLFAIDPKPGNYTKKLRSGNRLRSYRLHVPIHFNSSERAPVIIAFHGSSASASVIERETRLDERADSLGFIVAYPEGLHRGWNIGDCCNYSFVKNVDDVKFAMDLIRTVSDALHADSSRVFVTGYSDGGSLSYLIACAHPDRIAAAAGVGSTFYDPLPKCGDTRKLSILHIHATEDTQVPFAGKVGNTPANVRGVHSIHSASEVVQFWRRQKGCQDDVISSTSGRVIKNFYGCGKSRVEFFTIKGGEHGWPGGGRGWIFSPVPPKDLIASDTVVRFFLNKTIDGR